MQHHGGRGGLLTGTTVIELAGIGGRAGGSTGAAVLGESLDDLRGPARGQDAESEGAPNPLPGETWTTPAPGTML